MRKELLFLTNGFRASRYTLGSRRRRSRRIKKRKKMMIFGEVVRRRKRGGEGVVGRRKVRKISTLTSYHTHKNISKCIIDLNIRSNNIEILGGNMRKST